MLTSTNSSEFSQVPIEAAGLNTILIALDQENKRLQLPSAFNAAEQLNAITALTNRLFPGDFTIVETADPEWPEDKYLVVNVLVEGEPKTIVKKEVEWLVAMEKIVSDENNLFRLTMSFKS